MVDGRETTIVVVSILVLAFLFWMSIRLVFGSSNCFQQRARSRRQQQERAAVLARIRLEEEQRRRLEQQEDTGNMDDPTAKALRLERILESLQFETPTTSHGSSSLNENEPPPNNYVMDRLFASREEETTAENALADWSCGICLESYQEDQALCCSIKDNTECKHVFHEVCALEWLQEHSECPLCRITLLIETAADDDNDEGNITNLDP